MQITEEQRQRAEANRLAALAKRKQLADAANAGLTRQDPWKLFKCRKVSQVHNTTLPKPEMNVLNPHIPDQLPEKFRVRLEICSPISFSINPEPIQGFRFPGKESCLEKLRDWLSNVVPTHYTQVTGGGRACVYNLEDYCAVQKCLKLCSGIEVEEIPWLTFNVIEKLSKSITEEKWIPCRPEHLSDENVNELIERLPKSLVQSLLPFQRAGVEFGLRRGGRCLIADEMGLGKTLQAIAIAGCFMNKGSVLVVCPAILRYSWAEEIERWLPCCLPSDIHLVFGHQNNPANLPKCPKVVVISYTMLSRLRKSLLELEWAVLIVDESHHLRCTKKPSEPGETEAVLSLATKVEHIVLLSGTPSLSRPYDIFHQINMLWNGLLGKTKYEFAKTYCSVKFVRGAQGKVFQDFSKGTRLEELNVLLKQSVMIRRLKEKVLAELPPKRRQILHLSLKNSDIDDAIAACKVANNDLSSNNETEDVQLDIDDEPDDNVGRRQSSRKLSHQELGVAKVSGFCDWLSFHPIIAETDSDEKLERSLSSHKMIIFAHHHKVLDRVQEFVCSKGIEFVRIDGYTSAGDRQLAVQSFQSSKEVKIAIIGILAGGAGLNLSAAQNVVFLELPKEPAHLLQAEDRAHRRGQNNAVNIYIFCAKDTSDESLWQKLNKSLHRVSSTMNGKYDAVQEIEVERISCLEKDGKTDRISENHFVERASEEASTNKLMESPKTCPHQNLQLCEEQNDNFITSDMELGRSTEGTTFEDKANGVENNGLMEDNKVFANSGSQVKKLSNETTELHVGESGKLIEVNAVSSLEINSLRFEVSQYTGRIHLYLCTPGVDLRPRPLFENFRPEELESLPPVCPEELESLPPAEDSMEVEFKCIKDDPRFRPTLVAFIKEWNALRPIEQKKLLLKPLQLPLSVELCCLNESLNHDSGGLLKGGSKKRRSSLGDISDPLPSNASWRKVCIGNGKREREYEQGWTLLDEPLCKLCQAPCKGYNAKKPEFFEDLFCKLRCYEEYRLRTSNRYIRKELFQIERGICTICKLNCHKLVEHIKPLSCEKRREYITKVAPELANRTKLFEKLVLDPTEGNAWHADHIVPVYRGGGECTLENMRTLCVACHAKVTAAQAAERRSLNAKARKQLKAILKNVQNRKKNVKEHDEDDDDDLLMDVPGSSYSRAPIITSKYFDGVKQANVKTLETLNNPIARKPKKLATMLMDLQRLTARKKDGEES